MKVGDIRKTITEALVHVWQRERPYPDKDASQTAWTKFYADEREYAGQAAKIADSAVLGLLSTLDIKIGEQ